MYLEIRYYKRFDPDLIALIQNGVDLTSQLPAIIKAYAHGETYHFYVPSSFCKTVDLNEQKQIHNRVTITDEKSIQLLSKVREGYRNTFCKILLREALLHQNLSAFFLDQEIIQKECARVQNMDTDTENIVTATTASFKGQQKKKNESRKMNKDRKDRRFIKVISDEKSKQEAMDEKTKRLDNKTPFDNVLFAENNEKFSEIKENDSKKNPDEILSFDATENKMNTMKENSENKNTSDLFSIFSSMIN